MLRVIAITASTLTASTLAFFDPAAAADLSPVRKAPPCGPERNDCRIATVETPSPNVWGWLETRALFSGTRMAPNGVTFDPLFALNSSFNIGILPDKKLYVFTDENFWMQRPGAGITNPSQGQFDFSKREFDFTGGVAWNYYDAFELRVSTYAFSNLNRGTSLRTPAGFKDGVLVESRYYLGGTDKYDLGRLSFLSVGYYPTKSMVGGNGEDFRPGFYARAYLTYGLPFSIPWLATAYLYGDASLVTERVAKPKLLDVDAGLAIRPFEMHQNIEFRVGGDASFDLQDHVDRDLIYTAVRFAY